MDLSEDPMHVRKQVRCVYVLVLRAIGHFLKSMHCSIDNGSEIFVIGRNLPIPDDFRIVTDYRYRSFEEVIMTKGVGENDL